MDNEGVKGVPILPELISEEPWVKFIRETDLADWGPEDEIAYNQMHRQMEKHRFFIRSFIFLTENQIEGDYFEFGCHRGRTFRMALSEARRHLLDTMQFLAFDSFQGLPSPKTDVSIGYWTEGALATSEEDFLRIVNDHGIYTDHIETYKGFYDQSLTKDLQKKLLDEGRKIGIVNLDCDLYESATKVFEFIEPFLQEGSVVYLDDLFCGYKGSPVKGVSRAFHEFKAHSKFKFAEHLNVGWGGRSYVAYEDDPTINLGF